METIAISKFKATCLATLERVRKTGKPIRITRHGLPVADVLPPAPDERSAHWLGAMSGTATLHGDVVGPSGDLIPWEATHT